MKFLLTWQGMALCSAFFAALTAIFGKIGVTGINSDLATFYRTLVVVGVIAVLITVRREWGPPDVAGIKPIAFLVLSGLATGASWICYYRALQMGPASRVAPFEKVSVAMTVLLAIVFLGEQLTWKVGLGAAFVVTGVVLASLP